jgi:hypothetical protein
MHRFRIRPESKRQIQSCWVHACNDDSDLVDLSRRALYSDQMWAWPCGWYLSFHRRLLFDGMPWKERKNTWAPPLIRATETRTWLSSDQDYIPSGWGNQQSRVWLRRVSAMPSCLWSLDDDLILISERLDCTPPRMTCLTVSHSQQVLSIKLPYFSDNF